MQTNSRQEENYKIFLIHGRNAGDCALVARFLERVGIGVYILHELPDMGMTIIEKFESYSNVKYAVALLSADDHCRHTSESNYSYRARQNVIFEFGYFIGKLGRKNVCALVENSVEKPSDLDGLVYIPFDRNTDSWKTRLVKSIRSADIPIKYDGI